MTVPATTPNRHLAKLAQIESRSIDHVPHEERYGTPRDQFTLWFGLNANIFPIILGGLAVFLGLDFLWACISIVIGMTLGVLLVGLHAIQGAQLGVPQMIQSRAQFGFFGAVFVFVASLVLDFGFLAAQLVIQAQALNLLVSAISVPVWIVIVAVPVVVITIYGHAWIHIWQRWMTPILGVTFTIIFIQALAHGGLDGPVASTHAPSFALFMATTAIFVIAIVSWAPYVSDYSRYLPETVSPAKTFVAVSLGNVVPGIFCAILGAYVTGLLPHASSTVAAVQHIAGTWALPVIALSLVGADVVNAYTGMLALASIASCFKDVRHSIAIRVIGSVVIIAGGTVCALLGYKHFVTNLSNFLDVLLFVFIPWTAINLTDYFLIRRGDYDVAAFFNAKGQYGGLRWQGLVPYALAVAVEVPFISQTFYTGPLVSALGGVDISWVVGGVAGFIFYLVAVALSRPTRGVRPASRGSRSRRARQRSTQPTSL